MHQRLEKFLYLRKGIIAELGDEGLDLPKVNFVVVRLHSRLGYLLAEAIECREIR